MVVESLGGSSVPWWVIVCFVLAVISMELRLWDVIVSCWLNVIGELDVDADILLLTICISCLLWILDFSTN